MRMEDNHGDLYAHLQGLAVSAVRRPLPAVLEDLQTRRMTKAAKGMAEAPGRNVRTKAGLSRAILGASWGQLERMLGCKCRKVIKVPAHFTSQTCSSCGAVDAKSRRNQATFVCTSYGRKENADINAASNILAARIAASGRGGACAAVDAPLGASASAPMICQYIPSGPLRGHRI